MKDTIQCQQQELAVARWKAAARKEAIEKLPFFLRPTVRRLPAQPTGLPSPSSIPNPVEIENPTVI